MENFKIEKELGKGAFGTVYLVTRKQDEQKYALKQASLANLDQTQRNRALNEVRILASIKHPHIIRYKECFYNEQTDTLNVVTQYADKGDLTKAIKYYQKQHNMKIPEDQLWRILTEVSKGLQCLHRNRILHRDLKPANILQSSSGCKIADMNTSKVVKSRGPLVQTQIGTPFYAPPETWKDQEYSQKCDIWSLGVVMYELAALRLPFPARDKGQLNKKILEMEPPSLSPIYSEFLKKLIFSMLAKNEASRPSIWSILQHCQLYQKVKNQTQQSKVPHQLLQTIVFDEEESEVNWKLNLPPPRFSPCKPPKEEPIFRKALSNNYEQTRIQNSPTIISVKKSIEDSVSQQKDNIMYWRHKQGLPPRMKAIPQATPPITRKNSKHNNSFYVKQNNNIPQSQRQKSFSVRSGTPSKLPAIHTDRNSSRHNIR